MESQICLVVDLGSGEIKAGVAGEENPIDIFPTLFGKPKYGDEVIPISKYDHFIGG